MLSNLCKTKCIYYSQFFAIFVNVWQICDNNEANGPLKVNSQVDKQAKFDFW